MTLAAAVIEQLAALLAEDDDLAVLAPPDHPAAGLGDVASGRVVPVPGGVRAAIAAGLGLTDRAVVSFWRPGEVGRPLLGGAHVLVVGDASDATSLWAAGVPVATPCWVADVGRLLRAGLSVGDPVVLHAPDAAAAEPDRPLPPLQGGQLRWLERGSDLGAVLACGPPVAHAVAAAAALAREGVRLGVVEAPWQAPGRGPAPVQAARAVTVLDAAAARALASGALAPEDARGPLVPDGDVHALSTALVHALDDLARRDW